MVRMGGRGESGCERLLTTVVTTSNGSSASLGSDQSNVVT